MSRVNIFFFSKEGLMWFLETSENNTVPLHREEKGKPVRTLVLLDTRWSSTSSVLPGQMMRSSDAIIGRMEWISLRRSSDAQSLRWQRRKCEAQGLWWGREGEAECVNWCKAPKGMKRNRNLRNTKGLLLTGKFQNTKAGTAGKSKIESSFFPIIWN